MRDWILVALAGVIVALISAYTVYSREQPRPGREIVDAAQMRLASIEGERDRLAEMPLIEPLADAWTSTRYVLEACGVRVDPVSGDSSELADAYYSGPVAAWHATLAGRPLAMLACLDVVNTMHSVTIGRFTAGESGANAVISVLGRLK